MKVSDRSPKALLCTVIAWSVNTPSLKKPMEFVVAPPLELEPEQVFRIIGMAVTAVTLDARGSKK